jgi:hypothetical protein
MLCQRTIRLVLILAALCHGDSLLGQQPQVPKLARFADDRDGTPRFVYGAFSPDEERLAAMKDQVTIWNLRTKREAIK